MQSATLRRARALRIAIPIFLIVIGLLALAGCIYIPVPEHPRTPNGKDVRELVGDVKSRKPLRVGMADRDTAVRLLGNPRLVSASGRSIAYHYKVIAGHWYGLCVGGGPLGELPPNVSTNYDLLLEFTATGTLRRYELRRNDNWGPNLAQLWEAFTKANGDAPATQPDAGYNKD